MCTTRFVTVWQESSLCPAKRCHGSSCPRMQSLAPGWRGSVNQLSWWCQLPTLSGWWTYPSETYEFASWDDDIPNIYIYGKSKKSCSKPPTSYERWSYDESQFPGAKWWKVALDQSKSLGPFFRFFGSLLGGYHGCNWDAINSVWIRIEEGQLILGCY